MQQHQRWSCHLTELNRDKSLCCRRTHTFGYLLLLSPCWLVAAAVAARADKETQLVKRYTSIYPVSVLLRVAFCQLHAIYHVNRATEQCCIALCFPGQPNFVLVSSAVLFF